QAAAVRSRAGLRRQQFAQQIAMALFDVHKLKADAIRQPRCAHVVLDQLPQVIVVEKRIGSVDGPAGGPIDDGASIEDWIMASEERPPVAIAAGMGQLQTNDETIIRTEGLPVRLPALAQHLL